MADVTNAIAAIAVRRRRFLCKSANTADAMSALWLVQVRVCVFFFGCVFGVAAGGCFLLLLQAGVFRSQQLPGKIVFLVCCCRFFVVGAGVVQL